MPRAKARRRLTVSTIRMPQLGESVVEGTIGKWLVQEGQRVEKDQPVVESLTDKAESENKAAESGVVTKIHAQEGATVTVGAALCDVEAGAQAAVAAGGGAAQTAPAKKSGPTLVPPPTAEASARVDVGGPTSGSPAIRKLAR